MTAPTYIYRQQSGEPSALQPVRHLMKVARKRLRIGQGPFTVRVNGREGGPKPRRKALAQLRKEMIQAEVGTHFRVYDRANDLVFSAKAAAPAEKIIDTSGNAKIDKVWSYAKANWENITFLGAYVCKFVAGTSTHSQHAYGNAVDIGAASMERLKDIANDLVRHQKSLSLEHVIVADRIWTRGQGWQPYTGEFHYHVHADANPNFDSSLPCGVRP